MKDAMKDLMEATGWVLVVGAYLLLGTGVVMWLASLPWVNIWTGGFLALAVGGALMFVVKVLDA